MALFAETDLTLPIITAAIAALGAAIAAVLPVWLKLRHERITRESETRESQKQQESLETGTNDLENQLVSALSRLNKLEGRVSQLESELSASQRSVRESPKQDAKPTTNKPYYCRGPQGADAEGVVVKEGLLVRKGSSVRNPVTPKIPPSTLREREQLLQDGVLIESGGKITFTKDHCFDSPSKAAGVVLGRSANGLLEWKDAGGGPLGDDVGR